MIETSFTDRSHADTNWGDMMQKLIAMCAVVAALALWTGKAQADGFGYSSYGHGGHAHDFGYSGHSHGLRYGTHSHGYGGFVQPMRHSHWQRSGQWNYHPPQIIRHGNHFHMVPGHLHFNPTGHRDAHW